MLYPPVADLLKKVDSRYLLVNLVAPVSYTHLTLPTSQQV